MLLTFGHGTATAGRMTELLRGAGVAVLVDVRTAPGSRRHPHVARAELERWLPEAGISYRWDKRLGGFRKAAPDSPDTTWREDMFRGYAAHMRTEGFQAAMDEVLAQADADRTVVMCAPTSPWPPGACRSGICCTTGGSRSTASPPACGGAMTACSSTTRARPACCDDCDQPR
ncbi:MAG: DUF488 family protein [Streptosporangiaceae bacterium]